ncbi:MAG: hypothetical protein NVSMB9_23180 [Isosphaeraceae bacterium]
MNFWRWRGFWDGADIALVAAVAISGATLKLAPKSYLAVTGWFVIGTAVAAGVPKTILKVMDYRATRAKAVAEAVERQEREAEVTRLREHATGQARRVIQAILASVWQSYFVHVPIEERHKSRVTLFRCAEAAEIPERGKHLTIFARKGRNPDSTCWWPVDDNDIDRCHGVAAIVWFYDLTKIVIAKCDWDDEDPVAQKTYAASMSTTIAEAKLLNIKSKVVGGSTVMVKGRRWGVLVLDSREEGQVSEAGGKIKALNDAAALVGAVLEGLDL